ncbi:very short patch repair endonuclease [Rahnella sp. CJA17(1/100)]|uniref:very short patch repair endonuclease n=1 Tax=Rahnella sp. CJA17(1/100) TaxID=2508951 RepID=UPI00106F96A6|nr:DNA mismatch endonuclease Vsr [Rahnella sp. CJA17(1/100)]
MADVHDSKTRRKNMRAIKNRGTAIEKKVSDLLVEAGFSFREQGQDLPGKPDFVVDDYKAVIFVHGCFWHHHNCYLFKIPATRTDFWMNKIQNNVRNDQRVMQDLSDNGWRILIVWECSLRGRKKLPHNDILERIEEWLCSSTKTSYIDTKGIFTLP